MNLAIVARYLEKYMKRAYGIFFHRLFDIDSGKDSSPLVYYVYLVFFVLIWNEPPNMTTVTFFDGTVS